MQKPMENARSTARQRSWAALLVALVLSLWCGAALAVPAYSGTRAVLDGSGNELKIRVYGDEFLSYIATPTGDLLYQDAWGYYHYVVLDGDAFALGDWVFEDAASDAERVNLNAVGDDFQQKLKAFLAEPQPNASFFDLRGSRSALEGYQPVEGVDPMFGKWVKEGKGFTSPESPAKGGVCPLLVLRIAYTDVDCLFTDEEWNVRVFGDQGISGYYSEVSNDRFTYVPAVESGGTANDGVITVTLPINRPLYTTSCTGHSYGQGAIADVYTTADGQHKYAIYGNASLFAYGLEAADRYVDFAQYDRRNDDYYNGNGDGYVSPTELAILVVNAGFEASFGLSGAGDPTTWACSWYANTWWIPDEDSGEVVGDAGGVALDGVMMYKFTIMGENLAGPAGQTAFRPYDYSLTKAQNRALGNLPYATEIGTACHELGHDLGLRDLYDTSDSPAHQRDVSSLSLMADGSWGYTPETGEVRPGSSPSHLDAYSKICLGFYEPQVVSASGVYPVTQASDSANYNILRVNTENPDVYYLVENRTFTGFDRGMHYKLEMPGGVVYWRVDEAVIREKSAANEINNTPGAYGVMPEYVYFDYRETYRYALCLPFRNQETDRLYPAQRVLTLAEKPSVSLMCYAADAPKMDVWLNASAPIALTLTPEGAFPEGEATDRTVVLGAGSDVSPSDLSSVTMDGERLQALYQYEVRSGSIILTLKSAYLNTLAAGTHTLRLALRNGMSAEAQLTVYAVNPPQTGDTASPALWGALLLLSLGALVVWRRRARRA